MVEFYQERPSVLVIPAGNTSKNYLKIPPIRTKSVRENFTSDYKLKSFNRIYWWLFNRKCGMVKKWVVWRKMGGKKQML